MTDYKTRVARARRKGRYTDTQWKAMLVICGNRCVACGEDQERLEADHIVSVSREGCECIANMQPLCAGCNTSKWANEADLRPADWSTRHVELMMTLPAWAR